MPRYQLKQTFHPMNKLSSYILGFAWADGSINSEGTSLRIASKDSELQQIRDFFYEENRPLYHREDGVYVLQVSSKKIVHQLKKMGFTSQKSMSGIPIIPEGFEQYFLLGLFDGDGCVSVAKNHNSVALRIFLCGNKESMCLVQKTIRYLTDIEFTLRERQTEGKIFNINGIESHGNFNLFILDCSHTKKSMKFLSWLYGDIYGIPVLRRKYEKFISFVESYDPTKICPLCNSIYEYQSTQIFCHKCQILLRRLRNRRQDHYTRNGIWYPLSALLKIGDTFVDNQLLDNLGKNRKK